MFLQTDDGLVAVDQITLIEDYLADDGDWTIHYRYGSEVRTTTADGALVKEALQ